MTMLKPMSLLLCVGSSQKPIDSLDHEDQCRNDCEGTVRVASSIIVPLLYILVQFIFFITYVQQV